MTEQTGTQSYVSYINHLLLTLLSAVYLRLFAFDTKSEIKCFELKEYLRLRKVYYVVPLFATRSFREVHSENVLWVGRLSSRFSLRTT